MAQREAEHCQRVDFTHACLIGEPALRAHCFSFLPPPADSSDLQCLYWSGGDGLSQGKFGEQAVFSLESV